MRFHSSITMILLLSGLAISCHSPPPQEAPGIPRKRVFYHNVVITEHYDRFRQQTRVSLPVSGMAISPTTDMRLGGFYLLPGDTPTTAPDIVALIFLSFSDDWRYRECHALALLADDHPLAIPDVEYTGRTLDDGSVMEAMTTFLDVPTFLAIVTARTVEGQLCTAEFTLAAPAMEALRDLASRIPSTRGDTPKRWSWLPWRSRS